MPIAILLFFFFFFWNYDNRADNNICYVLGSWRASFENIYCNRSNHLVCVSNNIPYSNHSTFDSHQFFVYYMHDGFFFQRINYWTLFPCFLCLSGGILPIPLCCSQYRRMESCISLIFKRKIMVGYKQSYNKTLPQVFYSILLIFENLFHFIIDQSRVLIEWTKYNILILFA